MKQNNAWVIEGRFAGEWCTMGIRLTRREIRLAMKELRLRVGVFMGRHLRIRKVVFV